VCCKRKLALGVWLLATLVLIISTPAIAHPGGLNTEGCHNDRKRGVYHCHTAPPARVLAPPPAAYLLGNSPATCGTKRYCKEMVSCAEAVHYLYRCGLQRLDSDRDGIPCETLCGNGQSGMNRVEQILRGGQ
jgi:Excalibur calcium-binding domain